MKDKTENKKQPRGRANSGVKFTIFEALQKAGKNGISKDKIHEKLVKTFPDRNADSMRRTLNSQIPGKMSQQRNVKITRLENGNYSIVS